MQEAEIAKSLSWGEKMKMRSKSALEQESKTRFNKKSRRLKQESQDANLKA